MDRDVVIVGAGVVGAAIARELTRYELDVTLLEAGPGRGRRHEQGEHRAAAHRLRRQARHARVAPGRARLRAAVRVRAERRHPGRADRRAAGRLGRARSAASSPGIVERSRANGYARDPRARRATSSTAASRASASGARRRARGARREPDLPVHHAARVRDRGGAGGLRAAPRHERDGSRAARRTAASAWRRAAARSRRGGWSTRPGCAATRSTACSATSASPSRPRRGELIVFDKLARPLVRHIVLAVPTKVSKGVLVARRPCSAT